MHYYSSRREELQISPPLGFTLFVNTKHTTEACSAFCSNIKVFGIWVFYPISLTFILSLQDIQSTPQRLISSLSLNPDGCSLLTRQSNSSDNPGRKLTCILELHLPHHVLPSPIMPLVRGQVAFTNLICKFVHGTV